jgi:PTS system cellobiose-specific IIA component
VNQEQTIMQIIVNGGDARSKALMAVRSAREGDFQKSDQLIKEAKEAMGLAHEVQTQLIQAETRGEKTEISLLLIHAQDHLMNAITVVELAVEMIEDKKLQKERV